MDIIGTSLWILGDISIMRPPSEMKFPHMYNNYVCIYIGLKQLNGSKNPEVFAFSGTLALR